MSKPTMSSLLTAYNELAIQQGKPEVSSFKNIKAAQAALASLQTTESETMTEDVQTPEEETVAGLDTAPRSGPKYNSAGKRGPAQGVGKFCKELLAEGKSNAEILAAVQETFPNAKTTNSCVSYYRTAMKKAAVVEKVVEEVVEE